MSRFYSLTKKNETIPCDSGNAVYKWTYTDAEGKCVECEKNVQEEIQSYLPMTDYKSAINEKGEYINGEDDGSAIYMDTTQFGSNFSNINDYIAQLVNKIREEVKNENGIADSDKTGKEVAETKGKNDKEVAENEKK